MDIIETAIPAVKIFVPARHGDARGWLSETWRRDRFAAAGLDHDFVQDNAAFSAQQGTIRGLHFQLPPQAQGKLVRAALGSVWDVAVDLRAESPTYGQHVAYTLSAERGEAMWVPPGFAHGFCTLTPETLVIYKMTALYAPQAERGLRWDDPALAIAWPVAADRAILKPADRTHPVLAALGPVFPAGSVG